MQATRTVENSRNFDRWSKAILNIASNQGSDEEDPNQFLLWNSTSKPKSKILAEYERTQSDEDNLRDAIGEMGTFKKYLQSRSRQLREFNSSRDFVIEKKKSFSNNFQTSKNE